MPEEYNKYKGNVNTDIHHVRDAQDLIICALGDVHNDGYRVEEALNQALKHLNKIAPYQY